MSWSICTNGLAKAFLHYVKLVATEICSEFLSILLKDLTLNTVESYAKKYFQFVRKEKGMRKIYRWRGFVKVAFYDRMQQSIMVGYYLGTRFL